MLVTLPIRRCARLLALISLCAAVASCGESSPPDHNSEPRRYIYQYGSKIRFGYGGDSFRFRLVGWSHLERSHTWTDGIGASLALRVPASNGPVRLRMRMAGHTKLPELPFQPVHVYVNAQRIGIWKVAEERSYYVDIPAKFVAPPSDEHEGGGRGETPLGFTNAGKTRLLLVDLHIPKAASPFDLDVNWDIRRLGIRCSEVQITQTPEQATADASRAAADAAAAAALAAAAAAEDPIASQEEGSRDTQYELGTVINFGAGKGSERYKVSGWYTAEEQFTWTGNAPGVLSLKIPPPEVPLTLRAKVAGMTKPGTLPLQPVEVTVNGQRIAEWQVAKPEEFEATIPINAVRADGTIEISLRALKPAAPKAIGTGGDVRILGLQAETLTITPAE